MNRNSVEKETMVKLLGNMQVSDVEYVVYSISEVKEIALYAELNVGSPIEGDAYTEVAATTLSKEITLKHFKMKVFSLLVKELRGNSIREIKALTGVASSSAIRAFQILKERPVALEDIPALLETYNYNHPIPNPVEFDSAVKSGIREHLRLVNAELLPFARKKDGIVLHHDAIGLLKGGEG